MTPEDRLTQVLRAEATKVDPSTEWSDVERGLATRRRARRFRQAALSTVAAAAMVAAVAVLSTDDDSSGLRVVPPITQPTVEVTTTVAPTTTAVAATYPPTVLVQRADGAIVELSTANGRQLRELMPSSGPDEETYDDGISMTDAGDVAYTERSGRVRRIDLRTGSVQDVGAGYMPAISPDGTKLALVTDSRRPVGEQGTWYKDRLVVRDLHSGRESTWDEPMPEPPVPPDVISGVTWSADSRHLAVEHGWEDGRSIALFDTQDSRLTPSEIEQGRTVYSNPVYLGDALVVLADDDAGNVNEAAPDRIVTVDPTTGRVTATLVERLFGRPVAADPSGDHLLYILSHEGIEQLYRLADGEPIMIADDVITADW